MKQYQTGMTLGSTVIVSGVLLFFVFSGFKIFPTYMEFWNVKSSFSSVANDLRSGDAVSAAIIKEKIGRNFSVNNMSYLHKKIRVTPNKKGGLTARIKYEREVEYIGNLHFLMKFDHSLDYSRNGN